MLPQLQPGQVYRTAHLRRWSTNPTRLARRLEREGALERLGHGLYLAPRQTRFGPAPATDEALLDAFLNGAPWVATGPMFWNALALGSTALFVRPLIYNTQRTGRFSLGGRDFDLRRAAFPTPPTAEWYVIDLLRNARSAGVSLATIESHLTSALTRGRFDEERLLEMAACYGRQREVVRVRRALEAAR